MVEDKKESKKGTKVERKTMAELETARVVEAPKAEQRKLKYCWRDKNRTCDDSCAAWIVAYDVVQDVAQSNCLLIVEQDYRSVMLGDVASCLPGAARRPPVRVEGR